MKLDTYCVLTALALIAATAVFSNRPPRTPSEYQTIHEIWSSEDVRAIADAVRQYKSFPTAVQDVTSRIESVGEEMPLVNGSCTSPLMVPNKDKTLCVFAQRLDVGKHYIMTGGNSALKEPYESLVKRLMAFAKFFVDNPKQLQEDIPFLAKLFDHPAYRKGMQRICPGMDYLDPFQLSIIIQAPGQTVAIHYDAPWFYGADRKTLPQWLLVVMDRSGLFEDIVVKQIQGVAYIHPWNTTGMSDDDIHSEYGGGFFFYPQGARYEEARIAARPGSALLIDGSKCVHGTDMYRPHGNTKAPPLQKDQKAFLVYSDENSDDTPTEETLWNIVADGEVVDTVKFKDLRISLVWRSKCFKDEEEFHRYKNTKPFDHSYVLSKLKEDLVHRGHLKENQDISVEELGSLLLKVYVDYPLPSAYVPVNYCALPRLLGGGVIGSLASTVLSPFCA